MGAHNPADRPQRIDQMNVLDRNIGIAETKIDTDKIDVDKVETNRRPPAGPAGASSDSAPRGLLRLALPLRRLVLPVRRAWQFSVRQSFSSLTRRIIFLNVAGLLALVIGILYLSQFRAGLIDARVQSLLVQGESMAVFIAASATADSDSVTMDPERLLELAPGESYDPSEETLSGLDFPINPERVAPVLRRLVSPTNTRARIYDRDGGLILDSRNLYDVLRFDLPPPAAENPGIFERAFVALRTWFNRGDLPIYRELGPQNGKGYDEVDHALNGFKSSMVRINERGEVIVSVALPVQRFLAVRGALKLSTQGADIDNMVTAERLGNFHGFLVE